MHIYTQLLVAAFGTAALAVMVRAAFTALDQPRLARLPGFEALADKRAKRIRVPRDGRAA